MAWVDRVTEIGDLSIGVRVRSVVCCHAFGPRLLDFILLLVFERSDKVDTLLDGADGCDFVVNFHRLQGVVLDISHSGLIVNRLVKKLALILVHLTVRLARHDNEVRLPAIGKSKVLLG